MKIEKVNENQIRCTLTREDLASRELKISELAYGTEKAKSLFRDMMQQANFEFGFEAEDIPLMIEAIPLASGKKTDGGFRAEVRFKMGLNNAGVLVEEAKAGETPALPAPPGG